MALVKTQIASHYKGLSWCAYLLPEVFQENDLQCNLAYFDDSVEYLNVLPRVFEICMAGERPFDNCETAVHQKEGHGEPQ